MSDRDVLKRATEALRETAEPSPEDVARLRARLLGGNNVTPIRRPHTRKLRWILPLAAAFVAGTALAATPGGLQTWLDLADRYLKVEWLAPSRQTARTPKAKNSAAPLVQPAVVPPAEPSAAPTQVVPEPVEAVASSASEQTPSQPPAPPKKRAQPTPKIAVSKVAPAAPEARAPSLDLSLYKEAHALHFRERNYGAALAAWEQYLDQLPNGTLAIEARYNRALCLVQLARFADARAALTPFARGEDSHGYRQREAQRLLEALEKKPEPKP